MAKVPEPTLAPASTYLGWLRLQGKKGGSRRLQAAPAPSVADPYHFDTDPDPDPDPGKNDTDPDPDPAKRPKYQEDLQKSV